MFFSIMVSVPTQGLHVTPWSERVGQSIIRANIFIKTIIFCTALSKKLASHPIQVRSSTVDTVMMQRCDTALLVHRCSTFLKLIFWKLFVSKRWTTLKGHERFRNRMQKVQLSCMQSEIPIIFSITLFLTCAHLPPLN